jgi:hypothetical protein
MSHVVAWGTHAHAMVDEQTFLVHYIEMEHDNQAKDSDTETRTPVSCVRGKYDNHLHHIGFDAKEFEIRI